MPSGRRRGDRLVPFLEYVLLSLLGTAAQSRVVGNVSCCIFCVRSFKAASSSVIGKSRYGTLSSVQGSYAFAYACTDGRSADKPENGVEKLSEVKSPRFYTRITTILSRTTRGPFRN